MPSGLAFAFVILTMSDIDLVCHFMLTQSEVLGLCPMSSLLCVSGFLWMCEIGRMSTCGRHVNRTTVYLCS
jgi:hypothetical protein